jgi:glucose/arabinose dehydrogenase
MGKHTRRGSVALALALVVTMAQPAVSQSEVTLTPFAIGLVTPVDIASAGDARLFVVEQAGRIKIVEPDGTVSGTFLDITGRVRSGGEEGLLGLAFAPDYASSGRFFVYYTRPDGNNQLSSFVRSSDTQADPNSETPILTLSHPTNSNHNGGDLNFRDGLLYVSTGDGGSSNDPPNNAQNKDSLLGKILRLDVTRDDFPNDPARNYGIPRDNPFVDEPGADEIWVMGLRNPWRFSFDSFLHGMYIGDVGQGEREEIDHQEYSSLGGENYGWRCMEGTRDNEQPNCEGAGPFVPPVAEYDRDGDRCAVTGGYVYRGTRYEDLRGEYLYMDFCSGELFALHTQRLGEPSVGESRLLGDFNLLASSFGQAADGELYVADLASGTIYHVEGTSSGP